MGTPWLPTDWQHPTSARLATGHHLRPIRASDVDIDYAAVMGSRERLWRFLEAEQRVVLAEADLLELASTAGFQAVVDAFNRACAGVAGWAITPPRVERTRRPWDRRSWPETASET